MNFWLPIMIMVMAAVLISETSRGQSPCERESTWQIAPPRLGHPGDLRYPLACVEVDGVLRCQ